MDHDVKSDGGLHLALGLASVAGIVGIAAGRVGSRATTPDVDAYYDADERAIVGVYRDEAVGQIDVGRTPAEVNAMAADQGAHFLDLKGRGGFLGGIELPDDVPRGGGIGTRLVSLMLELAQEPDVRLRYVVLCSEGSAVRFWQKMGFVPARTKSPVHGFTPMIWRPAMSALGSRATMGAPHIVESASPLDYSVHHGEPVHRLSLHLPGLSPPRPNDTLFARTEEKRRTSPVTGRPYKVPKIVVTPGCDADPTHGECVGFLDYHVLPYTSGAIYIDFYTVRRDERGHGYGTHLIDELYLRFADAPWIDWGRVMSDQAEATMRRIQRDPGMPRTHGKIW